MVVRSFPPVELADPDGVLCAGGDLQPESLLLAYRSGIFPWPISEEYPIVWFSPPKRALIFLDEAHIPRRLKRSRTKSWTFTVDRAFEQVIDGCAHAKNRTRGRGTWITPDMVDAYTELYRLGWCHSFEAWHGGELGGGMYGISIGRMFAGESMFYRTTDASKLALWYAIDYLRERGVEWLDCQQLTPLVESFGAREVPREKFLELLAEAVTDSRQIFDGNL